MQRAEFLGRDTSPRDELTCFPSGLLTDPSKSESEMAAWHYEVFLVAKGALDIAVLTSRLSRELATIESPSPRLLLWGDAEGDRIDFWTDHQPLQLLARLDLRTPSDRFRGLIIELAREFSLQLLNVDDMELAPDDAALMADIRTSAAYAAATNPPEDEADEEEDEPATT